jgi:hypothetical protein
MSSTLDPNLIDAFNLRDMFRLHERNSAWNYDSSKGDYEERNTKATVADKRRFRNQYTKHSKGKP